MHTPLEKKGWFKMHEHYYQNGDFTICCGGHSVVKPFSLYSGANLLGCYSTFAVALKAFELIEVGA